MKLIKACFKLTTKLIASFFNYREQHYILLLNKFKPENSNDIVILAKWLILTLHAILKIFY